jgi:putative NADH-flavin reductase
MTVCIFGVTGMVGRQLLIHSLAKGWRVRAFGRHVEKLLDADLPSDQLEVIKGYIFDEKAVREAIRGCNAVLSALGGSFDGTDKARSLGMKNIVAQMLATGVQRIVALGGLGVLQNSDGQYLMDLPTYPAEYLPVGREHQQAYWHLRNSGLDWTFVCAPNIVSADANNRYQVAAEAPGPGNHISAGNLALCMVEAVAFDRFLHQRIGLADMR